MVDSNLDSNVHPEAEKLQGFSRGLLAPEEAASLEEHLAACDECCRLLEATPNDSFVGQLRDARDLPSPDTQPFAPGYSIPADENLGELADHLRYRVIRLLGQGGMGAVYLAEHRRMGRLVALKIINPQLLNHSGALMRFQQEVKTAAKLDHANIVAAFDADQAGNSHFLVMEYVEGQNLADYLAEIGPLPVAQACEIIRQAALGLQHAHERGMVHRDIKPHNLMLTPTGEVKVLDFGLARLATEAAIPTTAEPGALVSHLTGAGAVMGTADYIAPEQARDAHLADGRSDVYSLGCTLYYLLTGQPPFPNGTTREKLQLHSTNFPLWLRDVRPEIPESLARIVAKMMAKKPEDRVQTAAELAAALKPHAGNIRPKHAKLRRALVAVGAMIVLMAALACAAWMFRPAADQNDFEDSVNRPPEQPASAKVGEIRRWERHDRWYVHRILVAPNGQSAWSVGRTDFRRWSVATGTKVREKITPDWIEEIVLSPDGKHILTTDGWTGFIRIIDADTLDEIRSFRLGPGQMRYWQAAWFPDGKQILTGGHDAVVRIWDVEKGKPVREFKGHEPAVGCVGISRDGTKILTGNDMSSLLKVWNVQTGEVICSFGDQACQPNSAKFVLNDKAVLSCGSDGAIRLFDSQTGKELRDFTILDKATKFERIALFNDGRHFVAGGSNGHLAVWNLDAGTELYKVGTGEPVCAVAITADDRDLLLGTTKGEIIQWRLPTLTPPGANRAPEQPAVAKVREFRRWKPHDKWYVHRILVGPDGQSAWSVGQNDVRRWDVATQTVAQWSLTPHWIEEFALSPDGKQILATDGTTGVIRIFDADTLEQEREFELGRGWMRYSEAAWFPDGQQIVTGGLDGVARIWDVKEGKPVREFKGHTPITCVAISQDGTKILIGSNTDRIVKVWNLQTNEVICSFEEQNCQSNSARFVLEGKALLSCGRDNAIHLFDAQTGKEIRKFAIAAEGIRWNEIAIFRNGRHFVASDPYGGNLGLWDLDTGKELYKVGTNFLVCALAITADNRDVLLGTETGQIIQWRLPAVVPIVGLPAVVPPAAKRASLKDLPVQTFHTDDLPVHAVAISPDDKLVAAGGGLWRPAGGRWTEGSDFDVRLFDRKTGQELRRFKGPTKPVFAVAFSPDGQQIAAVGTGDKRAYLWGVKDGKLLHTFVGHTGAVIGINFLSDGRQLLTTSFDKSARLWDATTGLEIRRLGKGIEADWGTAALLPGERQAVVGGLNMLVIADVETGAVLQQLPWPGGRVVQMGVSPDGTRLLAAGGDQSDGRLRLWDLTTGKSIRTFDRLPARNTLPLPSIPSGCILRVAYLPDGNRCLTAEGNVSRVRDVHTGKVLHTFDGHADCVMAVAVSLKGRFAVSGGLDQKVRLWPLPEPAVSEKADGK